MADPSNPALASQVTPDPAAKPLSDPPRSYTYYHAGPLFSLGDLTANVRLSSMIRKISNGKYQPILPQDLEQRDTTPHSIRDQDIKALLSCDLALFKYDGAELDSGTVVEYMVSKFADMPAVILRSDFRGGGDQGAHKGDPWNLMSSSWPRTVGVVVDGMIEYKIGLGKALQQSGSRTGQALSAISETAGDTLLDVTARKVVDAFDQALTIPPRLPPQLRENVYRWLALAPGFKAGDDLTNGVELLRMLEHKEDKGLFDLP